MDNKDDDSLDINPSNEDTYIPPEEQYGDQSPAVASPQGKNFVVVIIFVVIAGIMGFLLFGPKSDSDGDGSDKAGAAPLAPPEPLFRPSTRPPVVQPPKLPTIAPPQPPKAEDLKPKEEDVTIFSSKDPKFRKRVQSQMLIRSGGVLGGSTNLGSGGSNERERQGDDVYSAANDNDPSVGFADSFYNQKNVPHAFARKLGNTGRLIVQGKIIETILETPINTDIPGAIRGIVSRDVYAESGRKVLIPKGSRVIGTYNNFVIRGNKRVNIIWSRVIRPDGVDIMIRSGGADQLGAAGVEGIADNKYAEIFSSAFLVSAINIGVGVGIEALEDDQISQTTNTDGSSTRNSTASQEAAIRAVDLFGSAAENLIQDFINLKPTITIDQGTRIGVFVNRDLLFPNSLVGDITIIQ